MKIVVIMVGNVMWIVMAEQSVHVRWASMGLSVRDAKIVSTVSEDCIHTVPVN